SEPEYFFWLKFRTRRRNAAGLLRFDGRPALPCFSPWLPTCRYHRHSLFAWRYLSSSMIAALVSFKSPLASRPMTSTRSSSRLLMAVLFNQTSSGWRSQSKGTFLISSEGDIIIKFQHSYVRVPSWPTVVARAGTLASTLSE